MGTKYDTLDDWILLNIELGHYSLDFIRQIKFNFSNVFQWEQDMLITKVLSSQQRHMAQLVTALYDSNHQIHISLWHVWNHFKDKKSLINVHNPVY